MPAILSMHIHVCIIIQYCTLSTSPAIDMNVMVSFCSTVTAQVVRVESTPQPSCLNEPIVFVCMTDFGAVTIRWIHKAFNIPGFSVVGSSVGDTRNNSDGTVVANLTMKSADGVSLLASTLTLYPPLNTSLNNTNITCEGTDTSVVTGSGFDAIQLEGK